MHTNTVYALLKSILSELTGRPPQKIFADQSLKGDLHFTSQGLFSLAVNLNKGFQKKGFPIKPNLHGDETSGKKTVAELRVLISKRFD